MKSMNNLQLEKLINQKLISDSFQDYAPNGLQVAGRGDVQRIITGVTACQALLDQAVSRQADAVIVHHGYFWKNESPVVTGMKRQRLKTLLTHDINLYAYHLPLDAHAELGNNAQLARLLGITVQGEIAPLLPYGTFSQPMSGDELTQLLSDKLQRQPLYSAAPARTPINRVAWTTGGGQSFIEQAAEFAVDAFITGEASEKTIHVSREMGIHFYAAGHHATERGGIQALGQWLADQHGFDVCYVDIDNPV